MILLPSPFDCCSSYSVGRLVESFDQRSHLISIPPSSVFACHLSSRSFSTTQSALQMELSWPARPRQPDTDKRGEGVECRLREEERKGEDGEASMREWGKSRRGLLNYGVRIIPWHSGVTIFFTGPPMFSEYFFMGLIVKTCLLLFYFDTEVGMFV